MLTQLYDMTARQKSRLEKKKINTIEQLVRLEPRKYIDARRPIVGQITLATEKLSSNGRSFYEYTLIEINTKTKIKIRDFRPRYDLINFLPTVMVVGYLDYHPVYGYSMMRPDIISTDIKGDMRLIPQYSKFKDVSERALLDYIESSVLSTIYDPLPAEIRKRNKLPTLNEMARMLHFPNDEKDIVAAKKRLLFDDLLYFALGIQLKAVPAMGKRPLTITNTDESSALEKSLPFTLTSGQKEVVEGIKEALMKGEKVNALIQGDVACGKSITAFLLMLLALENGYQAIIMAPTVILAKQHFEDLKRLLKPFGYKVGFLASGIKKKEKNDLLKEMETGACQCVVGTHGFAELTVKFKNLGLAIIDEEQRFGVETREELLKKSINDIAFISMSATPIPRTLAETIYGDSTKVYSIKGMPAGRKPVDTIIINEENKVPQILRQEVLDGRQAYVVCPAIEESDSDKRKCKSVKEVAAIYTQAFRYHKNIRVDVLTGNDSTKSMAEKLQDFQNGKINILVSTTVVEVGVNNPNASVIVVQNAELFGLSTLHQLRGRVRRGSFKPYCLLVSTSEDNVRLKAMVRTDDGFELSKIDLETRKSGDLLGIKQSGENKLVEEATIYPHLYNAIKPIAKEMIQKQQYSDFFEYMSELYPVKS